MPQLTLQRATHVFNRIKTETAFQGNEVEDPYGYGRSRRRQQHNNSFTLAIDISVDHPVTQQAEAYRNLALGKLEKIFRLMEIGTKIRADMAVQQAKCGVTERVTARVMATQKIKILEHLLESVETGIYNKQLLEDQANAIKARLATSTQGTTVATVSTVVLTAEDREKLTAELAAQRSALMALDDQLATLNATNHITIDENDLKILQAAGLAA